MVSPSANDRMGLPPNQSAFESTTTAAWNVAGTLSGRIDPDKILELPFTQINNQQTWKYNAHLPIPC